MSNNNISNNNNNNNNNNDFIWMSSLLAGRRLTNLGHHLYHSKVVEDLSHNRHTHKHRYVSKGLRFNVLT